MFSFVLQLVLFPHVVSCVVLLLFCSCRVVCCVVVVLFLSYRVLCCCGVVLVVSCVVLFLCVCVCDLFLFYLIPQAAASATSTLGKALDGASAGKTAKRLPAKKAISGSKVGEPSLANKVAFHKALLATAFAAECKPNCEKVPIYIYIYICMYEKKKSSINTCSI